ncbi:MAG: TaqI-like C-terminal specificity domain-containing protein [candidate division Zixibacteria bacterium]|nr:TaqI-like C-terminal specificity domain-containing protein [candidate division Zixibacteria bacterium]
MINSILTKKYNKEAFEGFIQGIILSLSFNKKRSETRTGFKSIQQIAETSRNNLDLVVFVAKLESSLHARVEITKNTYAVLKNHARSNALVAYISDDSSEWRLSLITTKVTRTKDGIKETTSNPHRFSYVLGPNAKVATPSKMLQGTIDSITDLENKFSLAVVSKEFFTQIATQYSKLVGGTRGEGRKAMVYKRTLRIESTDDAVNANFAIRLIGRLVFCWFLKQKKGHLGNPLIPSKILSVSAVKTIGDYYHSICVPLFFEVLNKPQPSRPTFFSYSEFFEKIPFLNGGLFQDHTEDSHKFNKTTGMSEQRGVVNVPDIWFSELFQIFEEYNFTIDENTSIDTELSIDPEMLGRIFENLLAEVNPETGASARKSTGSFYTPREIVDFMVEESLIAHFKTKTNISEAKLRALSSYDLDDDLSHPIDQQERKLLVEAIHDTTVLDPACGSGAFPIGVLQRLVHILGVLDPECSIYSSKIPPEMRRQLQKHSLTYVRKLGVIRECIHGVDIQPIAIDISRLRCFLTLIVDQQVDDNAPNRGIEPLPNLDFKFVCANTLIKPPVHEGPLFGDEFADALGELIDEYFAPVDQLHKLETARKLQQLISDKTKKELESIINNTGLCHDPKSIKHYKEKQAKSINERVRLIDLWDSYKNIFENKLVGFFDTRYFFPAVYRNGGFDIVIGNPPYISFYSRQSQLDKYKDELKFLRKTYNFTNKKIPGRLNTVMFFMEKALSLSSHGGIISFIIDANFIELPYRFIRKYIIENSSILYFVDKISVFENVNSDQVLLSFKNEVSSIEHSFKFYKNFSDAEKLIYTETIQDTVNKNKNYDLFTDKKESFIDNIVPLVSIFDTVTGVQIGIGGERSYNGVDIKNLFYAKEKLTDNYYPVISLRGVDFYRYSRLKHEYFLNFDEDLGYQINKKVPKCNIAIPKYKNYICSEKIIVRQSSDSITASYSDDCCVAEYSAFSIKQKDKNMSLKFLIGILNSKYITWYARNNKIIKTGYKKQPQIRIKGINNIPIKKILEEDQKPFIEIVDKILAITKSDDYSENSKEKERVKKYEKQIDQLVYKLYGLTRKEIKIIESGK